MAIRIIATQAPIFHVFFPDVVSDADVEAFKKYMENEVFARHNYFGFLSQAAQTPGFTASQRRMIGEWAKTHDVLLTQRCRGNAFVLDSAFARGVLSAINWLARPKYPIKVFDNATDALAWLRERMSSPTEGHVRSDGL